jgi:hypothetical protein
MTGGVRWQRVLLAAARLAALYAIGVAILMVPIIFLPGGLPTLRDLSALAVPAATLFLGAFLILAVARRAGFATLWALLCLLWGAVLFQESISIETVGAFIVWSAFALPLHALGAFGVTSGVRVATGRVSLSLTTLALVIWMATLLPAVALLYATPFLLPPLREAAVYRIAASVALVVWVPVPFVLAALSLRHVWIGTAPSRPTAPAAELPVATVERDV